MNTKLSRIKKRRAILRALNDKVLPSLSVSLVRDQSDDEVTYYDNSRKAKKQQLTFKLFRDFALANIQRKQKNLNANDFRLRKCFKSTCLAFASYIDCRKIKRRNDERLNLHTDTWSRQCLQALSTIRIHSLSGGSQKSIAILSDQAYAKRITALVLKALNSHVVQAEEQRSRLWQSKLQRDHITLKRSFRLLQAITASAKEKRNSTKARRYFRRFLHKHRRNIQARDLTTKFTKFYQQRVLLLAIARWRWYRRRALAVRSCDVIYNRTLALDALFRLRKNVALSRLQRKPRTAGHSYHQHKLLRDNGRACKIPLNTVLYRPFRPVVGSLLSPSATPSQVLLRKAFACLTEYVSHREQRRYRLQSIILTQWGNVRCRTAVTWQGGKQTMQLLLGKSLMQPYRQNKENYAQQNSSPMAEFGAQKANGRNSSVSNDSSLVSSSILNEGLKLPSISFPEEIYRCLRLNGMFTALRANISVRTGYRDLENRIHQWRSRRLLHSFWSHWRVWNARRWEHTHVISYARTHTALRRLRAYSTRQFSLRVSYRRGLLRKQISDCITALRYLHRYTMRRILQRRSCSIFRRLHPYPCGDVSPSPGMMRAIIRAWKYEYLPRRLVETQKTHLVRQLLERSMRRRYLLIWEELWERKVCSVAAERGCLQRLKRRATTSNDGWRRYLHAVLASYERRRIGKNRIVREINDDIRGRAIGREGEEGKEGGGGGDSGSGIERSSGSRSKALSNCSTIQLRPHAAPVVSAVSMNRAFHHSNSSHVHLLQSSTDMSVSRPTLPQPRKLSPRQLHQQRQPHQQQQQQQQKLAILKRSANHDVVAGVISHRQLSSCSYGSHKIAVSSTHPQSLSPHLLLAITLPDSPGLHHFITHSLAAAHHRVSTSRFSRLCFLRRFVYLWRVDTIYNRNLRWCIRTAKIAVVEKHAKLLDAREKTKELLRAWTLLSHLRGWLQVLYHRRAKHHALTMRTVVRPLFQHWLLAMETRLINRLKKSRTFANAGSNGSNDGALGYGGILLQKR